MIQQPNNSIRCSHSPSAKSNRWQMFWEFALRKNKLYSRDTNASKCAHCGKAIQIPLICREMMPTRALSVGSCWAFIARLLTGIIANHIDISIPVTFVIWIILGFGIRFVLKRIAVAILIASYSWEEITDTDTWQLKDATKN